MSFDPDSSDESRFIDKAVPKNYGRFYSKWVRNNFKSKEEGREVGEQQDFVMVLSPGMVKSEFHRRATEEDKREFAEEWKAYQAGQEQRSGGTPIELLPGLDPGRRDSLKVLYIHTIEHLAGLADAGIQAIGMGGLELRERARKYLESDASVKARIAALEKVASDVEWMKGALEELMNENQALHRENQSLKAAAVRGNGEDAPPAGARTQ